MITTMIAILTEMPYFWGLWWQSSQNDCSPISKDCDHDHSCHKMHNLLGQRLWSQSLQKCHVSHKNVMFMSLYMIANMIVVLFIRTRSWSQYSQKCPIFEPLGGLRPWSQFSQNALFLSFYEHCDFYFWVSPHRTHREHEQNEICKKVDPKKNRPANYSASGWRLRGEQRLV